MFVYLLSLCSDGDAGIGQLFRVQDADLRARVALQALHRWPLSACLELLDFCLNDPDTEASLRKDLELKKKQLDIYKWVHLKCITRKTGEAAFCFYIAPSCGKA